MEGAFRLPFIVARIIKDVGKLFGDMHKSPQTRINTGISDTKKHRPRGNHFVRKNSAFSAPSGVRTLDTLIKSQVLYQLS